MGDKFRIKFTYFLNKFYLASVKMKTKDQFPGSMNLTFLLCVGTRLRMLKVKLKASIQI